MSLAAFAPQAAAVLILSWRFRAGDDLALGLFLLTYAFVTFNKVLARVHPVAPSCRLFTGFYRVLPGSIHLFHLLI